MPPPISAGAARDLIRRIFLHPSLRPTPAQAEKIKKLYPGIATIGGFLMLEQIITRLIRKPEKTAAEILKKAVARDPLTASTAASSLGRGERIEPPSNLLEWVRARKRAGIPERRKGPFLETQKP